MNRVRTAPVRDDADSIVVPAGSEGATVGVLGYFLFRHGENAYFMMLAAEKLPNPTDRARETARLNDEVVKRYGVLVEKYPEGPLFRGPRSKKGLSRNGVRCRKPDGSARFIMAYRKS